VAQTPLREVRISWPNKQDLYITSKPHSDVSGIAQYINLINGDTTLFGNQAGLTINPNQDGSYSLASVSSQIDTGRGYIPPLLGLIDVENNQIEPLILDGLPEKCVWSRQDNSIAYCAIPGNIIGSSYFDGWYNGSSHTEDEIWIINASALTMERLLDLKKESGGSIDVINPILGEKEEYLVFQNKNDMTVWSLNIAAFDKDKINNE